MTRVDCPVCSHRIVVPNIDGVDVRFSAVACQHCKRLISIHTTFSTTHVKVVDSKLKHKSIDDEQLRECLSII